MKNNITNLEIKNFKSIKDIKIDCKRINVFIGEPNVGKSNILEALSLFVAETCPHDLPMLKDYIRYEKYINLFYDSDRKNTVSVNTNLGVVYYKFHLNSINMYDITIGLNDKVLKIFDNITTLNDVQNNFYKYRNENINEIKESAVKPFYYYMREGDKFDLTSRADIALDYNTPIKKYIFKSLSKLNHPYSLFLRPPYGDNLYTILESNPNLYDEVAHFFTKYGLDLALDTRVEELVIQKKMGNKVYTTPYSLSADTLQRIIFHLAAIETNDDAILLLEEPEAHSFPRYISMLADKMIDSKNNQFFVATHSPYMLTEFIEKCSSDEVSIFICTYENYETKVRALSKEEIANISETGIDLFFNIPAFTK